MNAHGTMTRHAVVRMQQRGVPPLVIDWPNNYGDETFGHRGARILFFSKRSKRSLKRDVGDIPYRRMSDLLDFYLIEADGRVVTVGRRYKHISRSS